ncbi:MAG: aldehyde dehydrogenase [Elusimicrobiaceae bacterium]|nr:aldehyde dehydrogenase [Elusimicrobiaceae bacterium]
MKLNKILEEQRKFFASGATLDIDLRLAKLKLLKDTIKQYEKEISAALKQDLGKSEFESFMCEIGLVYEEISYMLKNTKRLAAEKTVHTPLVNSVARSYTKPTPYGNTLIISPWNYPFLLTMGPLIDAIAAGNTAMIKPSKNSMATTLIMGKIIRSCFKEEYVYLVDQDIDGARNLIKEKFDFIFFTGSTNIGKEVLRCAAENLTPVVLELGGKSPCIVDQSADLKLAARRIIFGKFLNCGQTCVAPDYVLCHKSIAADLQKQLCAQTQKQYGKKPFENKNYGKIISEKHFDRLSGLMEPEKIIFGGQTDKDTSQIAPTIMANITWQDKIMQEEIFGPVLPILTFENIEEVIDLLNQKPKPLALYLFSNDKQTVKQITSRVRYGGGCINDTIMHLANTEMPFGGVGESGMGAYHGEQGFKTFTHTKSIVDKKNWIDFPVRYSPYRKIYLKLLKFLLK